MIPLLAAAAIALPPVGAPFDYQLGGAYPPPPGVRVVARDRTERPPAGTYGVCYVNGFQTQPQERGWWRRHRPDLLLRDGAGHEVADPGWPDEVLLDTRTAARRAAIARIVGGWLAGCARHGYRGAEADNLDSWTRSRGLLTRAGNVALAQLLARAAHRAGLAFGQKNAVELAPSRRRIGFDFAVVEECQRYAECAGYTRAYGRHVLEIEYTAPAFRAACRARSGAVPVILRDLDLVPRGRPGYVYRRC